VLGRLVPIFRLGGGARLGPGTQVMSWVSLTDVTGIMAFLLAHEELAGPVNLTSPYPVTNAEFTSALAAALHRPALLTVPVPVLRAAVGGVSSDLLSSARVIPRRLLDAGYRFRYPRIAEALAAELR
jgi:NAD dependent epimerase/dehydratase family enzyme